MKERPKVGDHVEFWYRHLPRTGTINSVAKTGVHFVIETPLIRRKSGTWSTRVEGVHVHRPELMEIRIPLSRIIRILPSARTTLLS